MASVIPSAQETPFRIEISDESIQLLKQKLELTKFPDELEDAGRDYGVPLADIQRLVARWKDGYDWRKHEKQLNDDLPQFKRDIQVDGFGTLGIHYIHQKSDVADAIPLLFVHGCKYRFSTWILEFANECFSQGLVVSLKSRRSSRFSSRGPQAILVFISWL
jgi:Epoxide hydrolase N terminus